ncbi:MAG: Fic family protein [Bacteroidales bacterium]|nr:Fic family protein [Bacteroidales bacterium]
MATKDIDYIPQEDEIEELRKRIIDRDNNEADSLRHANEELMPHFIYNSINLSGDRVSHVNTVRTLKKNDGIAEPTIKVAREIFGLRDAYRQMLVVADAPAVTTQQIAEIHKLFYQRIDEDTAGQIRPDTERRNYEAELNDFVQWLNNNENTECFHTAATAYRRYIYMHPFKGGNGHMARLILALTMHKYGYPAIIVPNKWKAEYDNLIKEYDEATFADFLRKCCFTSMNIVAANLGNTYSEHKTRHVRGINPETEILEYIRQHPGTKSIDMKKEFPKISYTKMTRIIRVLREEGKILFKGATKSGGYYAAETDSPTPQ